MAPRPIEIRRGLDIPLAGKPGPEIADALGAGLVAVSPAEFPGIKPKLDVKPGDRVRRGSVLFHDKRRPALKFRSPAGGTIAAVDIGQRRAIERIVIETAPDDPAETFPRRAPDEALALSRDDVLAFLLDTGYLSFVRQRPFSRIADADVVPKSIFVNAMATAPFLADPEVVVRGEEIAFQAGLNALTRLTAGKVHLCLPADSRITADEVEIHRFRGPHPAGNTSVHIHHVDPMRPQDIVWAVRAADLVLIGKALVEGVLPATRVIALGGPGVAEGANRHYRVRIGSPLEAVLGGRLAAGSRRIVSGDALAGTKVPADGYLRFGDSSLTVLPDGGERRLMGWFAPGLDLYSVSRTFLSRWLRPGASWRLDTDRHGDPRPMILTGLYDRYLPMDILADYLVRAVLAHDTDEAVKLGLLETDPEDFALCSFVCPSKMDVVGIIRRGLAEVEKEGI